MNKALKEIEKKIDFKKNCFFELIPQFLNSKENYIYFLDLIEKNLLECRNLIIQYKEVKNKCKKN